MKKTHILLSVFLLALLMCACKNKATDTNASNSVVGIWTQADAGSDSYMVLTLEEDGSGSLITMPQDIGVPMDYEFDGTSIVAHMGSIDDTTIMEYLKSSDQIQYNNILFNRD